jgi:hypothetical protein
MYSALYLQLHFKPSTYGVGTFTKDVAAKAKVPVFRSVRDTVELSYLSAVKVQRASNSANSELVT